MKMPSLSGKTSFFKGLKYHVIFSIVFATVYSLFNPPIITNIWVMLAYSFTFLPTLYIIFPTFRYGLLGCLLYSTSIIFLIKKRNLKYFLIFEVLHFLLMFLCINADYIGP